MRKDRAKVCGAVAVLLAFGSWGCQEQINYLKARNELNDGVKAFSTANYPAAAESFEAAIEMDPELLDARAYRAYSYMMQYIPGGESEENLKVAHTALDGFKDVLERDPDNELALSSIASLYFNMKEFDKAKESYDELLAKYPENKEAHYTIGVINWTLCYQPRLEVRADLGMKQEDPGPIKDDEAREELAERNLPLIQEGLEHLTEAVRIDPNYADAMAYINLLYRERADISESKEDYEKFNSMADEWVQKTLDTKKRLAEESTQETFQQE